MKIVIQTDRDFTPPGKRRARVVTTSRGGKQLRWYVSGAIYRQLPVTAANLTLSKLWLTAGGAP